MKTIYLLSIAGILGFASCDTPEREQEFAERDDMEVATDPEEYERGMREEEGSPEKESPIVDEEPDPETKGE